MSQEEQEIERKFLLYAVPEINYESIIRINQRYKADRPERIRREELFINPRKPIENFWLAENPKVRYEHTFKEKIEDKEGLQETNEELVEADFKNMLKDFPNVINKLRHVKPCKLNKGMKWEIDDFSLHRTEMAAIIIAEIEVPSMAYEVKVPAWLERYILKEITDDSTYTNFNLAKLQMYL